MGDAMPCIYYLFSVLKKRNTLMQDYRANHKENRHSYFSVCVLALVCFFIALSGQANLSVVVAVFSIIKTIAKLIDFQIHALIEGKHASLS